MNHLKHLILLCLVHLLTFSNKVKSVTLDHKADSVELIKTKLPESHTIYWPRCPTARGEALYSLTEWSQSSHWRECSSSHRKIAIVLPVCV